MDATTVFKSNESIARLRRIPIRPKKSRTSRTAQSNDHRREANHGHARARVDLADEAIKIRRGLRKGVDGIIEAALDLYRVKRQKLIKHGQFTKWVENEVRVNIRTGEWLINIASDPVITKPCHRHALPASIRTLYELTRIKRAQDKRRFIANGRINPGMPREEAIALRYEKPAEGSRSSRLATERTLEPWLRAKTARMVDACTEVDGGDVILAHIRHQELAREVSLQEFDRVARLVRRQLAKRRGGRC